MCDRFRATSLSARFTYRNTCGPARKTTETTMAAFSDGRLYAPLPEKTIPDNFIERHIPSVYTYPRALSTATMSFVLRIRSSV